LDLFHSFTFPVPKDSDDTTAFVDSVFQDRKRNEYAKAALMAGTVLSGHDDLFFFEATNDPVLPGAEPPTAMVHKNYKFVNSVASCVALPYYLHAKPALDDTGKFIVGPTDQEGNQPIMYQMFDDKLLHLDPSLFCAPLPPYKILEKKTISLHQSTSFLHEDNQWEETVNLDKGMRRYGLQNSSVVLALFSHLGASAVEIPTRDTKRFRGQKIVPRFPCQPNVNVRLINKERQLFVDHHNKSEKIEAAPNAGLYFTAAGCVPDKNLGSHPIHAMMYSLYFNTNQKIPVVTRGVMHRGAFEKPSGFPSEHLQGLCKVEPAMHSGSSKDDSLLVDCYAALCVEKEIEDLYLKLLGQPFWNVHSVSESEMEAWNLAPAAHKAMIMFSELLQDFQAEYDSFKSVEEWVKFYRRHEKQYLLSKLPNDCPDLFYRVYFIINSMSSFRLGFLEGLGRIAATLYSLFRKEPPLDTQQLIGLHSHSVYMSNLEYPPSLKKVSIPNIPTTLISPAKIGSGGRSVKTGVEDAERLFLTEHQALVMRK